MEEQKGPNKMIAAIVVVAVIAAAATGVIIWSGRDNGQQTVSDDTNRTAQQPTSDTANSGNTSTTGSREYKDGTYTAEGKYITPGGQESIDVKVTLANGTITDAVVTQKPISREAHTYQAAFVSGYKSQVVGKKIDDVSLSRVAGSSLTPNGFNSALDTIKTQAEA